jgi:hypothetical protein
MGVNEVPNITRDMAIAEETTKAKWKNKIPNQTLPTHVGAKRIDDAWKQVEAKEKEGALEDSRPYLKKRHRNQRSTKESVENLKDHITKGCHLDPLPWKDMNFTVGEGEDDGDDDEDDDQENAPK